MIIKRVYIQRIIYILVILLTVGGVFYLYLPPVDGIVESMNITVGENSLDIVCVGSSHVHNGINPVQMYIDKGYAAYDVAGGSQAPWQSYYYIKQICKKQKPKIIVFDTYMLGSVQGVDGYYQDYQTVNNMLKTPLSWDKIEAVMESKAESKLGILLMFPYTHSNWSSFTGFSLHKIIGLEQYLLGYNYDTRIEPYDDIVDVRNVENVTPIHWKNEKYLRRIIEYCKAEHIDLILTNTPWPCVSETDEEYFNYIGNIANEYDVPFLDGCKYYEEMGIDYMTDCAGDGGHLNHFGVTKYTKWLEDYIDENYNIEDHRGDDNYSNYEKAIEYYYAQM